MATLNTLEHSSANGRSSIYHLSIEGLNGKTIFLRDFKGKKLLIVNTASQCGFTKQYADLQRLYQRYSDTLTVLGVPCNQFGKQEPGSEKDIMEFCEINYGVTFPMAEKTEVKGPGMHPVYQWLTTKKNNGVKNSTVRWNFQKYLLDEEGRLIDFYYSITKPTSKKITRHL